MRIGIDARFLGAPKQGLGRYVEQLIGGLARIDRTTEFVIFARKGSKPLSSLPINFKIVYVPERWYTLAEQVTFPFRIYAEKLDLMHFTHFNVPILYRRPFFVTIHDLILRHYPSAHASTRGTLYFFTKFLLFLAVLGSALRRAKHIIVVSEFTRNDLIAYYPNTKDKITIAYCGADTFKYVAESRNQTSDTNPYLLYVGTAYPHKNLEWYVKLFIKWRENHSQYHHVFIGPDDFFYQALKKTIPSKHANAFRFVLNATDSELANYYKNASAFVYPSLYEGFGLPPLEAMQYSIPVLASNASSLPEILGDSALYFDPKNDDELLHNLSVITQDTETRNLLISRGHKQLKKYTWVGMAGIIHDLYVGKKNQYNP